MRRLIAYLPCYNESGNIAALTGRWLEQADALRAEGCSLEIVPIDDKSSDATLEIIRALERLHSRVRVIAHDRNRNLGGVLMTAIWDFLKSTRPGDLMCVMDGDNTHDPAYIHGLLSQLTGETGCVIASRYRDGSGVRGLNPTRRLLSSGARLYYSLILRVPEVRDYTCGYRLYTREAIERGFKKYGSRLVEQSGFSCTMELLYKLHLSGCEFKEAPFVLQYGSKKGESKMRVCKTVRDSLAGALRLRQGV